MKIKKIVKKVLNIPVALFKTVVRILWVLFPYFLILLGLGIWINPEPMPGVSIEIRGYIGFALIGIGGALNRIQDIKIRARIQAKVFKKVFDEEDRKK